MTTELYNTLSRAFVTDNPPTYAVGITVEGKVYVVAKIYESYYPTMPRGERNSGYCGCVIGELIDKGGYCALNSSKLYRTLAEAQTAFRKMAREQGVRYAGNARELKRLLKNETFEERKSA